MQSRTGLSRATMVALLALVLAALPMAQATECSLKADTFVHSSYPTQNFGALTNLNVGPGHNLGFLKFAMDDCLPHFAGIGSSNILVARLTFFINKVVTPGGIEIYEVTSAWQENTLTYNDPFTAGSLVGSANISAAGTYVSLDVTPQLRALLDANSGGTADWSFVIFPVAFGNTSIILDSKENTLTSHPAHLDIELVQVPLGGAYPDLVSSLKIGPAAGQVAAGNHNHSGYEPLDPTILRQRNLAGSGTALTPARSDHTHPIHYLKWASLDFNGVLRTYSLGCGNGVAISGMWKWGSGDWWGSPIVASYQSDSDQAVWIFQVRGMRQGASNPAYDTGTVLLGVACFDDGRLGY